MNQKSSSPSVKISRDRLPLLTKISFVPGTGLNVWGFLVYSAAAFAVFNFKPGLKF